VAISAPAAARQAACFEPASLWENGHCESFNSRLRDVLLDGEISYALKEVQT
jgi:putative transposase